MLPVLKDYIDSASQPIESLDINEVQYSEEFEAIENEIQKLQSLTPETPNWNLIIDKGAIVLKQQGKHLKIITYVIVAMYKKYKLVGLLAGLSMLADILDNEKDQIMPYGKRKKSRNGLIIWMVKFISEYRDEDYSILSLEDLEIITTAKQKVNDWFSQYDPDADSLPLIQIYNWFESAKEKIEAKNNEENHNDNQKPENIESVTKSSLQNIAEQDKHEEISLSEPELELITEDLETEEPIVSKKSLEVIDFSSVRDFVKDELLERLEYIGEETEDLFKLMTQSRKVLWNSIYYESLIDHIADSDVSDDYYTINDILYIQEPVTKIIELEKLYIKNPYIIEIQKHILDALLDGYMRNNDIAFKSMYNFIKLELKFLISQNYEIFEFSYISKQCIPEYLYDWVFTELVDDISVFREKFIEEYLELYELDFKIDKLKGYINKATNIETKMNYLLEVLNILDGDAQAKVMFLENQLNDKQFIKEIMKEAPSLKVAYQALAELYESQIMDNMEINPVLAEKIVNKREKLIEKIQL